MSFFGGGGGDMSFWGGGGDMSFGGGGGRYELFGGRGDSRGSPLCINPCIELWGSSCLAHAINSWCKLHQS